MNETTQEYYTLDGDICSNFINYIMTDLFIFLMPLFLYNLFIGIAVGEVNDLMVKGKYHLIKVRIDLFLKKFYLYGIVNEEKYAWQIPEDNFWRTIFCLLREKIYSKNNLDDHFEYKFRLEALKLKNKKQNEETKQQETPTENII
jgi:hypothetical protein